jgi:hypothetical protein
MFDSILITGCSDCSVCVWDLCDLELIWKATVHSVPIVAVAGCFMLDLIVSIDESQQVVYLSMLSRNVIHKFTVCEVGDHHQVRILKNGIVVITSSISVNSESAIGFYDLRGNCIAQIKVPGAIQTLETMNTKDCFDFLGITTSTKLFSIIDCATFKVVKETSKELSPKFLGVSDERKFMLTKGKPGRDGTYFIPIDF